MANHEREDDSSGIYWLFGLFLGLLGGAALGFLTAPKSGAEMRIKLRDTARDLPDRVSEMVDDSLDMYATGVNYLQLIMEDQTQRLKRAMAAGRMAAAKKREELELGSSVLPFQHR
jgi:gas vesicle protein